jgi:hypothetical protein
MWRLDLRNDWKLRSIAAFVVSLSILGVAVEAASADFVRVSPTGVDAGNDCHFHPPEWTPCATIQHAVDEAEGFDRVDIDAGLYEEEVVVDKPGLTLIGPGGPTRLGEPQAVIDGGSGTAIRPEAGAITIRGLKVTAGPTGTPIRTSGADVDGLGIQEDIISGGSSGVRLEADGVGDSIGFNVIEGTGDGIRLGAVSLFALTIQWNRFTTSIDEYAVLAGNSATIEGLTLEGNEMPVPTRIAGLAEERSGEENDIDRNTFESMRGPQLAIDGLEARIMENRFEGHGSVGCLQILGNQGGLTPSSDILVSANEFVECDPYGIELGPEVNDISIYGSVFPGTSDGVLASGASSWDVTNRVHIEENRIVGTTHRGVDNEASGTLNAKHNWWGCNAGPGGVGCDAVSAGVDSSDNVRLEALIGPRTEEDGIIELPTGHSIALDPGEEAEVAAVLTSDGSGTNLGIPTQGVPVSFSSSVGALFSATKNFQNGWTMNFFTAGPTPGQGSIVVSMDNQRTLVPVTIRGATTSAPPTMPVKTPHAPTLVVTHKRNRLGAGRRATVGLVSCADSCQIVPGHAQIVIGHHPYRGTVTPRGTLAAESTTPIRVALSRSALRALKRLGSARIRVTVTVTDAADQTTTRAISVRVSR